MAASHWMACLTVKLTHDESAEQRLAQYCVHSVVRGSMVDVPE